MDSEQADLQQTFRDLAESSPSLWVDFYGNDESWKWTLRGGNSQARQQFLAAVTRAVRLLPGTPSTVPLAAWCDHLRAVFPASFKLAGLPGRELDDAGRLIRTTILAGIHEPAGWSAVAVEGMTAQKMPEQSDTNTHPIDQIPEPLREAHLYAGQILMIDWWSVFSSAAYMGELGSEPEHVKKELSRGFALAMARLGEDVERLQGLLKTLRYDFMAVADRNGESWKEFTCDSVHELICEVASEWRIDVIQAVFEAEFPGYRSKTPSEQVNLTNELTERDIVQLYAKHYDVARKAVWEPPCPDLTEDESGRRDCDGLYLRLQHEVYAAWDRWIITGRCQAPVVSPVGSTDSSPDHPPAALDQERRPQVDSEDVTESEHEAEEPKGVGPRRQLFLEWYQDQSKPTHHSHAEIRKKWNALSAEERARICPASPQEVTRDVVI